MISIKKPLATTIKSQPLNSIDFYQSKPADFLQKVIEGLQDGILIFTQTGELLHANTSATSICSQINQSVSQSNFVPPVIWHFCKSLIEGWGLFPNKHIILSEEIVLNSNIFRLRVRWLDLDASEHPCLLVTIENQCETLKNVACSEVKKYHLTPREAETWFLYRANYSYKEIATKLHISLNTVKKHMKNIHAKRQANTDTDN